ncbi:hypothetical protein [Actinoplanes solisilvae]|uniref:hypothetical protein n=1 Tax=Actinoplanes solisilvae TaxID=2486853 RepID=UPI000FD8C0AF|nr:hypothetical protein [Actinoplanes solisilvae]
MRAGLLLTPLGMLALGLAGYGATLLNGPYQDEPVVTSGGWLFVFLAGAVVVLTVAMLRGNYTAWILTSLLALAIVLIPVAGWLSALSETLAETDLRRGTSTVEFTATATAPASVASSLGDVAIALTVLGAAWASVMLLLPSTRRALNLRRAR